MKLVYICRHLTLTNGHGRICWELCRSARQEGHSVDVLTRRCAIDGADIGVRIEKLFQLPKFCGRLRSWSFAYSAAKHAAALRRSAGSVLGPVIVHGFGDAYEQDVFTLGNIDWAYPDYIPTRAAGSGAGLKSRALRRRPAPRIVAVSRLVATELAKADPAFPAENVKVIYPGVDTRRFHPGKRIESRGYLSKKLELPQEAFWVVFAAGGDFAKRNFSGLVEALKRQTQSVDWRLLVVGDSNEAAAAAVLPRSRVRMLGMQTDLGEILPACDLFAYPAWVDEFAMVVLEAMASGLPVLVSVTTGASEILDVVDRQRQVVHAADIGGIAHKLTWISDNHQAAAAIGARNRKTAEAFDWSSVYRKYRQIYEELLQDKVVRS
ncbi:MAG: glycosyltransferase family 4 protein [Elusimicrobiota bacterium]